MKRRDTLRLIGFCVRYSACAVISVRCRGNFEDCYWPTGNWENSHLRTRPECRFLQEAKVSSWTTLHRGQWADPAGSHCGSVDIGIGVGTYGAMGAAAKGAPLRLSDHR